jgi:hypothetical protein
MDDVGISQCIAIVAFNCTESTSEAKIWELKFVKNLNTRYWDYRTELSNSVFLSLLKHNCGGWVKFWCVVPEIFSVKVLIF